MFMMHPLLPTPMRQALFLVALLLILPLSGCFGNAESSNTSDETSMYPSIWDRHTLEWNWTGSYARVLQDGPHKALPVQEALIEVDTSGTWEGGPNTAEVHLSYWLPSNTEAGEQVPVIAVVGGREAEAGTLALRRLGGKDQEVLALSDAITRLQEEATPPDGG